MKPLAVDHLGASGVADLLERATHSMLEDPARRGCCVHLPARGRLLATGDIEKHGDAGVRNVVRAMTSLVPELGYAEYLKALARRTWLLREWTTFLERWPLVLCPVSDVPPMPPGSDQGGVPAMEGVMHVQRWQYAFNLLGLPGIACPTGVEARVPAGVQLVAGMFREDLLLDAAEVLEARCGRLAPIDPAR